MNFAETIFASANTLSATYLAACQSSPGSGTRAASNVPPALGMERELRPPDREAAAGLMGDYDTHTLALDPAEQRVTASEFTSTSKVVV